MNHPLTDEIIEEIAQFEPDLTDPLILNRVHDMRAAADWQLEAVIEWLKTQTDYSGTFYYETLDDIETIEDALMSAMRPQQQEDN